MEALWHILKYIVLHSGLRRKQEGSLWLVATFGFWNFLKLYIYFDCFLRILLIV